MKQAPWGFLKSGAIGCRPLKMVVIKVSESSLTSIELSQFILQ